LLVSVAGRVGSWVKLLGVCWTYGRPVDGLWFGVLRTVKGFWVESVGVCGGGLKLVHWWYQVWIIGCSIGCWNCRLHCNVFFIAGG